MVKCLISWQGGERTRQARHTDAQRWAKKAALNGACGWTDGMRPKAEEMRCAGPAVTIIRKTWTLASLECGMYFRGTISCRSRLVERWNAEFDETLPKFEPPTSFFLSSRQQLIWTLTPTLPYTSSRPGSRLEPGPLTRTNNVSLVFCCPIFFDAPHGLRSCSSSPLLKVARTARKASATFLCPVGDIFHQKILHRH